MWLGFYITCTLGTTFVISMTFTTQKGTGTGEVDVVVETVDGIPVGAFISYSS